MSPQDPYAKYGGSAQEDPYAKYGGTTTAEAPTPPSLNLNVPEQSGIRPPLTFAEHAMNVARDVTSALPAIGGLAGGLTSGPVGAALGGAGGKAAQVAIGINGPTPPSFLGLAGSLGRDARPGSRVPQLQPAHARAHQ